MLKCDHHDYLEIACVYQLSIELTLDTGETLAGRALDMQFNSARQECIQLELQSQPDKPMLLPTAQLVEIKALTHNTHFDRIRFD